MSSTLLTPKSFTPGQLVFDDLFSGSVLNADVWNTFMTSNSTQGGAWDSDGRGGSGVGGANDADYDEPYEVSVDDGLTLNAVQQSVLGADWIDGEVTPQLFPVTAGVVDTYGKMEFDGGYLQISMKEPGGDGSWPGLWLLPGAGAGDVGNNFEIDIQEGGFDDGAVNPNDVMAYHLHTSAGVFGGVIDTGVDLTASFNTYAIDWIPGKSITWFLNGVAVAEITSAEAPIPDEPMELIMNNQVATSATSAWRTSLDSTTPYSMPMQVNGVQLYQTPGIGETIEGSNVVAGSPPVVAISTAGGVFTQAKQTISGTVDLADAGSAVSIFEGGVKIGSATANATGYWSASVTLAHQGANAIKAAVTNAAGQGTSAAVVFTLHSLAPRVAISPKAINVTQAAQTISGTVDLADAGSTVSIADGGVKIGSARVDLTGHWSASVLLANQGLNVITASDTNAAGTGTSEAVSLVLHTSAPTVALSTLGATVSQATQTIAGTVDLADVSSTVWVLDNGLRLGSVKADATGRWSMDVTLARQGANVLSAVAGNFAGVGVSAKIVMNWQSATVLIADPSASGQTYTLGDQNYKVELGGYANLVAAGDGADDVAPGAGEGVVTLGNGRDNVEIAGFGNQVTAGSGDDVVTGGLGAARVKLGDGADTVNLGGYANDVTVGDGQNHITAGSGGANVKAGKGADTVILNGFNNTVQLGGGVDAVFGGQGGDQITLTGGTANLSLSGAGEHVRLLGGASANIVDSGSSLAVDVGSSTGRIVIMGLASDATGLITLLNGAGGYTSVAETLGALRSDGRGGSMLSLGANGSIDIVGVTPSHLSSIHFAV